MRFVIDGSTDSEMPFVGFGPGTYIGNKTIWRELASSGGKRCYAIEKDLDAQCWEYDSSAAARAAVELLSGHRDVEVISGEDARQRGIEREQHIAELASAVSVVRVGSLSVVPSGSRKALDELLREQPSQAFDSIPGCRAVAWYDPFGNSRTGRLFRTLPVDVTYTLRRKDWLVHVTVTDGYGGEVAQALRERGGRDVYQNVVTLAELGTKVAAWRELGIDVRGNFDSQNVWDPAAARSLIAARGAKLSGWSTCNSAGLTLREFQRVGVEFILTRGGRAMIADEMGTGKTVQAIMAAQMIDAERVLVVAPAGVRFVWEMEIPRWAEGKVQILSSKREVPDQQTRWTVTSYDLIAERNGGRKNKRSKDRHAKALRDWRPDLVILDEVHRCKSPDTKRTIAAINLSEGAPRVIGLSGTPLQNRTAEAGTIASVINPVAYRAMRDAKISVERCRELLREVSIRRTKDDVLSELPPVTEQVMRMPGEIQVPDIEELARDGWQMPVTDIPDWAHQIPNEGVREFAAWIPGNLGLVEAMRARVGTYKAASNDVLDVIADAAQQEPVVVFTAHHAVSDALVRNLTERED